MSVVLRGAPVVNAASGEEHFKLLAEAIPQMVWESDGLGKMEYCNQRFCDYLNLPAERICGGEALGYVHPDHLPIADRVWKRALKSGEPYEAEYMIRNGVGVYRWHLARAYPVRGSDGQIFRWLGTCTDIHDRKREEEAKTFLMEVGITLSSSLDYTKILEDLANLIVPKVADWCAIDILNEQSGLLRRVSIAHSEPEKVAFAYEVSRRFPSNPNSHRGTYAVLRTGRSELFEEITDEVLARTIRSKEEQDLFKKVGLKSVILVPLTARGRTFGVISFINAESNKLFDEKDLELAEGIARKAALAVDNARLYCEAQSLNRAKDEFLATLSHELRTPMNVILGWIDLLKSEENKATLWPEAFSALERNAHHQVHLISDILDISRIVTGKIQLDPEEISLSTVVQSAVESIAVAARAKGISLKVNFEQSASKIWADSNRIHQVVWNLLSNAIKFTPQSGCIEVTVVTRNSHAEIKVTDSGEGILPEFLPQVFDRFRQEDSSTSRKHGGLGIGLGIVRYIVELHGGTVSAQSDGKGLGSTFVVRIPLSAPVPAVPEPKETLSHKNEPVAISSASLPGTKIFAGKTIVIVDDCHDVLLLTAQVLRKVGARTQTFDGAAEAFAYIKTNHVDVLLSDIGMPKTDGYEFVRKLRASADKRVAHLPAVALTAYAREEDKHKAIEAGFNCHLSKPVMPASLIEALASLLPSSL